MQTSSNSSKASEIPGITNHPAVELIRLMIENDAKSRPSTGEVSSEVAALQRKPVTPQPVKVAAQRAASDHDHYVNEFRVNPCRKANCNDKFCFNYHQPNQRRRRSFRKKDGTLNYSGVAVCRLYNKETGKFALMRYSHDHSAVSNRQVPQWR